MLYANSDLVSMATTDKNKFNPKFYVFAGHRLLSTLKIPGYEVFELEQEFNKWKEKTVEVYQQQITCMMRFKHEVLQLKYTVSTYIVSIN